MNTGQEYVTPEARVAEHMDDMSGVRGGAQAGMAPYPLYGLSAMGQDGETALPFWRKPMFCYAIGAAAGFGIGYAFFGWFKPTYMKKNPRKKKKAKSEE
jgi:hypothetical protein